MVGYLTPASRPMKIAPDCPSPAPAPSAATPARAPQRREVALPDLLGDGRELFIRHGEDVYRLSLTSKGKLILTK